MGRTIGFQYQVSLDISGWYIPLYYFQKWILDESNLRNFVCVRSPKSPSDWRLLAIVWRLVNCFSSIFDLQVLYAWFWCAPPVYFFCPKQSKHIRTKGNLMVTSSNMLFKIFIVGCVEIFNELLQFLDFIFWKERKRNSRRTFQAVLKKGRSSHHKEIKKKKLKRIKMPAGRAS